MAGPKTAGTISAGQPAPGTGPGSHPVGPLRGADDRHANQPDDRQCRRAIIRLPAGYTTACRPCRRRLRGEIWHPRPSRRRARIGARDGDAGGGGSDCPADYPRCDDRRGAGRGRGRGGQWPLGRDARGSAGSRRFAWRHGPMRRRRRAGGLGCTGLRQARCRTGRGLHGDQCGEGRRNRRGLRSSEAAGQRKCRVRKRKRDRRRYFDRFPDPAAGGVQADFEHRRHGST